MARVCARRAAGWAAKSFLSEKGIKLRMRDSFEHLHYLKESELISPNIKRALENLSTSVEKDEAGEESVLPPDVDLLDDAQQVVQALLPHSNP